MIFEFSQQAVARGGQAIFSDINLYWEVPKHFEGVPAIGEADNDQLSKIVKIVEQIEAEIGQPFGEPDPTVKPVKRKLKAFADDYEGARSE